MGKNRTLKENVGVLVKKYTMIFVLIGLILVFGLISPSFLSVRNIKNLIVQNTHTLIVAVGLSFIMMSGALDLSVGYQMSAIGVLTAMLMTTKNVSPLLAMACGVGLAILFGMLNGILSVKLKAHPIVITIGTTSVFRGISYIISNGAAYPNFPDAFRLITKGSFLGLSTDIWLAIAAVAIASLIYNKTYFGRYVKAMGGNMEATRLAGVNTNFIRIATFVISGVFTAIAAFILMSKQGTTNSTVGPGTEMTGMTAAILGGISFNSGEGKMWGLVTGVFILAVIQNGMQIAGWNQYIQYVVSGAVFLAAIAFDMIQRSGKAKKSEEKAKQAAL